MTEKRQVFVMGVKDMKFTTDDGEIIEGTSVHYVDLKAKDDNNFSGWQPAKAFLRKDEQTVDLKKHGYGLYNAAFEMILAGNRPRINIAGFEFIKKAELTTN